MNSACKEPFLTILKEIIFIYLGPRVYRVASVCKTWNERFNELLEKNKIWEGSGLLSKRNSQRFRDEEKDYEYIIPILILASHCSNGHFENLANFHVGGISEGGDTPMKGFPAIFGRFNPRRTMVGKE